MNTFTDTPELRAKAKKEALDKFTKHKHLLTGQNANSVDARRAVRSNQASTLFAPTAGEQEASAGRLPPNMARAAIAAGATTIGVNADAYARPGEDRTMRPRLEANREPVNHGDLGRQRFQEYAAANPSSGANPSPMPAPPVRAPLRPSSNNASDGQPRQAPRGKDKPRGEAARDGSTKVSSTLGGMASCLANDRFTMQTPLEQAYARTLRDARDAGALTQAFTGSNARVFASAEVGGSEPAAGANSTARFLTGDSPAARASTAAAPPARVSLHSRDNQPATAGQAGAAGGGGAGHSFTEYIATLSGDQRDRFLLSLSDNEIMENEEIGTLIEEILDVRERRRVQVEEEDARQHAQEVPPVSFEDAAPAPAQVITHNQAPPASMAPPSPSRIVALEKVLRAASPLLPEQTVSHVRGSPREVFNSFSSRSARYSPVSTMTCQERMRFWTGPPSNARVASVITRMRIGLTAVDSSRESADSSSGERTNTPERTTPERNKDEA